MEMVIRFSSLIGRLMPDSLHKRLSGRLVVQKILANSGWLLADQILRIGLGAIIGIWVARYLGPERFGAYNYALALAALVGPLSAFGLDALVVRDLVHAPENSRRILASVIVLRLCTGTASIIGAILLAVVLRPGDSETQILVLIVSSAALFQAISALDFWFQSKLQSKFTVIARDLAFVAAAGTKIWCVLNEAQIEIFGMAVLVEAVVSALSLWSMFRRVSGNSLDLRLADWMTIRNYIVEARSLVLTGLLIAVFMRVDRVILGAVLDNRAVGLYSVAAQLCEIFYILPTVLLSSLYPAFVDLYRRDEQLYMRRLIQIMRAFFYFGMVIAVFFLVFADKVVVGMFGGKFLDAIQITKVYIFALPLAGMSIIFSHRYVLNGTTKQSLIGVIVGSIVVVALDYLIVPIYGTIGAAYVALVAQVTPTLAVSILVDRNIGMIFLKAMLPSSSSHCIKLENHVTRK